MEVYTIIELSEKLNLTESKLRFHAKRYPDFLHTVGEGKATRYKEESIPVLRFILSCVKRNMSREQIEAALSEQFPRVIDIDSDVKIKTVELTQGAQSREVALIQGVFNDLATLKQQVQEDRRIIHYLGEQLEDERTIISKQQKEIDELKEFKQNIEQREQQANKSFWKKIWGG